MHNNPRISRKSLDGMLASKLNTPSYPCLGCDEWRVIAINLAATLKEREGECDAYEAEIGHAVDYCKTYAPKDEARNFFPLIVEDSIDELVRQRDDAIKHSCDPKGEWTDGLCPQAAALASEHLEEVLELEKRLEASLGTCPNCCDRPVAPPDAKPLVIFIGGMECDGNELCYECREEFRGNFGAYGDESDTEQR